MKKVLSIFLSALIITNLAACSGSTRQTSEDAAKDVLEAVQSLDAEKIQAYFGENDPTEGVLETLEQAFPDEDAGELRDALFDGMTCEIESVKASRDSSTISVGVTACDMANVLDDEEGNPLELIKYSAKKTSNSAELTLTWDGDTYTAEAGDDFVDALTGGLLTALNDSGEEDNQPGQDAGVDTPNDADASTGASSSQEPAKEQGPVDENAGYDPAAIVWSKTEEKIFDAKELLNTIIVTSLYDIDSYLKDGTNLFGEKMDIDAAMATLDALMDERKANDEFMASLAGDEYTQLVADYQAACASIDAIYSSINAMDVTPGSGARLDLDSADAAYEVLRVDVYDMMGWSANEG